MLCTCYTFSLFFYVLHFALIVAAILPCTKRKKSQLDPIKRKGNMVGIYEKEKGSPGSDSFCQHLD